MFKYLNRGISTPIAIGIIAILVVVVGGGVLAYQYWWQAPKEVEVETPKVEAPKDETANWKTYKNEIFELKYPPEAQLMIDWPNNQTGILLLQENYSLYPGVSYDYTDCDKENTWRGRDCDDVCKNNKDKEIRKDIEIDGHPAKFLSRYDSLGWKEIKIKRTTVCIKNIPVITLDFWDSSGTDATYSSIFDGIISTFQILKSLSPEELEELMRG